MPVNRTFSWLIATCAFLTILCADDPIVSLSPQEGETIVFAGDSITHQSLYTQYIEDFFFTRYPDRQIRIHNAGGAGDSQRMNKLLAEAKSVIADLQVKSDQLADEIRLAAEPPRRRWQIRKVEK